MEFADGCDGTSFGKDRLNDLVQRTPWGSIAQQLTGDKQGAIAAFKDTENNLRLDLSNLHVEFSTGRKSLIGDGDERHAIDVHQHFPARRFPQHLNGELLAQLQGDGRTRHEWRRRLQRGLDHQRGGLS